MFSKQENPKEDQNFDEIEKPEYTYRAKIIDSIISFVTQLFHLS